MLTLSVVVPATDRPPTLPACLAAIERAAGDDEVVVVDGPPGLSASAARNAGARHATGDVLVLLGLNRDFYTLLARRRGLGEAAIGVGLHAVHHLTAVAAVPAGVLAHVRNPGVRDPGVRDPCGGTRTAPTNREEAQ